jgi:hypothetical protein
MLDVYAVVLEENTASIFRFNQPPPWKCENLNSRLRHRAFIFSLINIQIVAFQNTDRCK